MMAYMNITLHFRKQPKVGEIFRDINSLIFRFLLVFVLGSVSFILPSCVKRDLDVDVDDEISVLNSILISNEVPEVYLHKSASKTKPNNFEFEAINNAKVELFEDGALIEELIWDAQRQLYSGTHLILQGRMYKIQATLVDELVLHGETEIPMAGVVTILDERDTLVQNNRNALIRFCEVKFGAGSPPRFFPHVLSEVFICNRNTLNNCLSVRRPVFSVFDNVFEQTIFTRLYFVLDRNHTVADNSVYHFHNLIYSQATSHNIDSMLTIVDVVSEPLYTHLMQLDDINSRNMYDPFVEPPTTFSNVNNGAGIVGGIGRARVGYFVDF